MRNGLLCRIVAVFLISSFFVFPFSASAAGDFLGTESNNTGILLPDEDQASRGQRIVELPEDFGDGSGASLLFSITADAVYELLVSNYGRKSFTLSTLPTGVQTMYCYAELNYVTRNGYENLYSDGSCVKTGVCYYGIDPIYGVEAYVPVYSKTIPDGMLGETFSYTFSIGDYLERNVTYYSFIKNNVQDGSYIYGTFTLYVG